MFLTGAQNLVYYAIDYPEAFRKLAEIVSSVSIAKIKLLKEMGADFLKRFGGYEQTNFFSPDIFKDVVALLLKDEAGAAKDAGIPMYYRVVTGSKPLLGEIADIGFDCIEGFEPCLDNCTNEEISRYFKGKACIWTGVSSPGHIGADDDSLVRQAVRDAVQTFGRKGFILGVTNSIRNHWPWSNTLAMVDEWKKVRNIK
jgi:uroporphyrinogen-III decarboxylase